jgi:hypothetical protein
VPLVWFFVETLQEISNLATIASGNIDHFARRRQRDGHHQLDRVAGALLTLSLSDRLLPPTKNRLRFLWSCSACRALLHGVVGTYSWMVTLGATASSTRS